MKHDVCTIYCVIKYSARTSVSKVFIEQNPVRDSNWACICVCMCVCVCVCACVCARENVLDLVECTFSDRHEWHNMTSWNSVHVRLSVYDAETLVVPLADTSTVSTLCPPINTTCPSMILMQNNVTLGVPGPGLSVTATRQLGSHHHRTGLCQQQQQQQQPQRIMCERFPLPHPPHSQPSRLAPLNVSVNLTPSCNITPS